jgi:hypothetical protein
MCPDNEHEHRLLLRFLFSISQARTIVGEACRLLGYWCDGRRKIWSLFPDSVETLDPLSETTSGIFEQLIYRWRLHHFPFSVG